jgi:diguanylate cyclase (GGDEF)-like protein
MNEEQMPETAELRRTRAEVAMLYDVSNAMRTTMKLDELLYIILTAVTANEGLGFNRAMLFLVNEKECILEGAMAVGPHSGEEAKRIWEDVDTQRMTLEDLIYAYHEMDKRTGNSALNAIVKDIKIALSEEEGLIPLAALEGMPFDIVDEKARMKLGERLLDLLRLRHEKFVVVPLKARDKVVGVLLADNSFTKKEITRDDIRILSMFANHAGLAIDNSRLYEHTLLQSHTDGLTRLWNHGYLQYLLSAEIKRSSLLNSPVSLLLIDIDNFKNYNDTIGHQAGDEVLKSVAQILRDNSRRGDIVARYGGEEFVTVLPGTDKKDAFLTAEKLRTAVEKHRFTGEDVQPGRTLTISIGISTYPEDAKDNRELIFNADMALYQAKRLGKNNAYASPVSEKQAAALCTGTMAL